MRKIIYLIILCLTFYFAYTYRESLAVIYNQYFVPIEKKVSKLEKNNYYRDYNFPYVQNVT